MADNSAFANPVPLGRAGTGEAFILDQGIATKPLEDLRKLNMFKDQQAARRAQQQAEQDQRNFAMQQKLLDNPPEFGLHYQGLGQQKANEYLNKYTEAVKANGGRPLNMNQQMALKQDQFGLKMFADASQNVEKAATDVKTKLAANKYYIKDNVYSQANGLFFEKDPVTGEQKIISDPTKVDFDKGLENIAKNHKNINVGLVSNDFVKTLGQQYLNDFSRSGKFDIATVTKANLPIQVDADGNFRPDKNGLPMLKVNPRLLMEAEKMPEFKTYLDGLMNEEDARAKADPAYEPKDRIELLAGILESEVYAQENKKYMRVPQGRAAAAAPKTPSVNVNIGSGGEQNTVSVNGRMENLTSYLHVSSSIAKNNGLQYYGEVRTPIYTNVNGEKGSGPVKNNGGNLNVVYNGLQYGIYNPKNGKRLLTPTSIKTPEQFKKYISENAAKLRETGYTEFAPFISGIAMDNTKTLSDFAESIESAKASGASEDVIKNMMAEFGNSMSKPTKDKRRVLIPYTGTAKLDADTHTQGAIRPTQDMTRAQAEIQRILGNTSAPAKPAAPAANKPQQKTKTPSFQPWAKK